MTAPDRRAAGRRYEEAAGAYLESLGYRILERNYRCRRGEIDLIARDGAVLVFIEVKFRRGPAAGDPAEAVDARKRRRIVTAARMYLAERRLSPQTLCRFDVVAFRGDAPVLIRDAFWADESI